MRFAIVKKWVLIIAACAVLCCAATGAGEAPAASPEAEATAPTPEGGAEAAPQPAKAYVLVSTAAWAGWLPLPESEEYAYPLRQVLPDGTEAVNLIHLTPDGVYMEDSTCSNHDCVKQGTVTLENRKDRILSNMIICLPNQVTLALYTPDEVLSLMGGQ